MATAQINRIVEHLRHVGLSDGQLLDGFIARRDEAAFEMLVRRHGPMVLGVCRRVLGNQHDAEDAFQATFLVLVRKAASVKPRELVGNWLYGVAYQTAVRARASAAKRHTRETAMNPMPEATAPPGDIWHDLQPLLDRELARLGDKYRVPIVLCDLEGKTRKEAADQLGVPEGTINSRLARGRTLLAERLTRQGVTLSAGALAALLTQQSASASVPTALVMATVKAIGGSVSANAALLADGVVKALFLAKLGKVSACVLLFVAVCGLGLIGHDRLGVESNASADQKKPPAVEKKTPPAFKPRSKEDAAKLIEQFKANANSFEITIARHGLGSPKVDLQYITLHSSNRRFEPSPIGPAGKPTFKSARINKEQALKLIALMDESPGTVSMFRYGLEANNPPQADEPSLHFQIGYGSDAKPGPRLHRTDTWGWHTLMLLSSLRVDGDAAKIVAELLKAIDDDPFQQQRQSIKKERTQLQGTWRLVSIHANGDRVAGKGVEEVIRTKMKWLAANEGRKLDWGGAFGQPRMQLFVSFDADGNWKQTAEGDPSFTYMNCEGTSTLEPGKKPRTIDLTVTRSSNLHRVENVHEKKGEVKRGIYEVIDDKLRICWGEANKDRPTEFSAKLDSPQVIWTLERLRKAPDSRLLGAWTVASVKGDIKKADWVARAESLTFLKPDKFGRVEIPATGLCEGKDGRVTTFGYAVQAEMKPAGIDFTTVHGIYQVERDSVKICLSSVDSGRPKDFDVKAGEPRVLIVLRRPALADWFLKLDTDGDGHVALYEWRTGGKTLDEFREWDLNDDGFISPNEVITHQAARAGKAELQKLEGTWLPVSGEQNGAKLRDADLKAAVSKLVFKLDAGFPGNTLTWHKGNDAGNTQKFKIDPDQTPGQITIDVSRKGIYHIDGDTLKLCIHYPFRGAGDVNFPKKLDGKGKPLLIVFKRQPQNARDKFQGAWNGERFELDGAKLDHVGSFLSFKDDTFYLRYGKADWKGTFKLDASAEPKRIDLTVTRIGDGAANSIDTWRGKHWQGIYVFEGDRLKIRLGKDRPKGFAGKTADEELHVLRRLDADASKDPAPPRK